MGPSSGASPDRASNPDWSGRALVACAIVVTFLLVWREVRGAPSPASRVAAGQQAATRVENWERLVGAGERIGSRDAKVVMIEFVDLQCPVCRLFANAIDSARHRYGDTLAVEIVHFPLPSHSQAVPAAKGAECARGQGRFDAFVSLALARQKEFGILPWEQYAAESGVRDLARFNACMADTARPPRITSGLALGDSIKIRGTPAFILNGWRVDGSVTPGRLDSLIRSVLNGTTPK